ncbi:uncharacterized protein LOC125284521 isoform X2 [Alosa alosa]|uniref:uncharacterized protein LOC125284521 isoform X2 n=1 Tax=Alosa alosa TaxID=278164 RepID=UPI00201553E5|nr:uncharacterized protein LOC125284521 isoform X2 [Alosa alosa]
MDVLYDSFLHLSYTGRSWELRWVLHMLQTMLASTWAYGRNAERIPPVLEQHQPQSTSINFLDLKICVDTEGGLHTSIYRKPTDRNTILRADSFHPANLISNIPYGQFQRLRRICDSDNDFEVQSTDIYERFKQRGYKDKTLNRALTKTKSTERANLFKPKPKKPVSNRTFCSLQYSNQTNKIKQLGHLTK